MNIDCAVAMAIFLVAGFVMGIINERRREVMRQEKIRRKRLDKEIRGIR